MSLSSPELFQFQTPPFPAVLIHPFKAKATIELLRRLVGRIQTNKQTSVALIFEKGHSLCHEFASIRLTLWMKSHGEVDKTYAGCMQT